MPVQSSYTFELPWSATAPREIYLSLTTPDKVLVEHTVLVDSGAGNALVLFDLEIEPESGQDYVISANNSDGDGKTPVDFCTIRAFIFRVAIIVPPPEVSRGGVWS